MAVELVMPKLGLTMTEGTVTRWLKSEGDRINKGEAIVEVSTDKVNTEVEAPASGILGKILVGEGTTVAVAAIIGVLVDAGEAVPAQYAAGARQDPPAGGQAPAPDAPPAAAPVTAAEPQPPGKVRASPKARKMARDRGIDLRTLTGSGPGGRIVARDVESAAMAISGAVPQIAGSAPPRADEAVEIKGMRKVIAERMSLSAREKPHVTVEMRCDVGRLQELHSKLTQELPGGLRPGFNDLLIKLTALSLARHPQLNAIVDGNRYIKRGEINIGVAVALEDGLVVPVIRRADALSVTAITAATADLIDRARAGNLSPDEMSGGTFTVSNLGMFGVESFTPVINPPECAILGICSVQETPVYSDGQLVARPLMNLCLSFDHRVIDGAVAARFLQTLKKYIEDPGLAWAMQGGF